MFYRDFKQFKNMLNKEALYSTPWDKDAFVYSYMWAIQYNLTIQYNFFETESKLEEDYRIEIEVYIGHSVFAYRRTECIFKGNFRNIDFDATPAKLLATYAEKVKKEDVVPYVVNRMVLGVYNKAYGEGYTFDNFRDYVKLKKDYHPVQFSYVLGELTIGEDRFTARAQISCLDKRLSVDIYINYYDNSLEEWSNDNVRMLGNDCVDYYYLHESSDIKEFIYVSLTDEKWYADRVAEIKQLL